MNKRARTGLLVAAITGMALSSCAPSDGLRTAAPVASADGANERALAAEHVLTEPALWPPLPQDANLTGAARRLCLPDLKAKATLPFLLQDRRQPGTAMVIFADEQAVAWCGVKRTADGIVEEGGAGATGPWRPENGLVVSTRGLTIFEGGLGPPAEWSNFLGLAPRGTAAIRMVVDGQRIDGVVGGQIYSITWRGGHPVLLAAFDAGGTEIDRLDEARLAGMYACTPPTGCPSPP